MESEKRICFEAKAERFQRLVLGSLLFLSYVFQVMPIIIFVAAVILISCVFGVKYTPFFRLWLVAINRLSTPPSTPMESGCPLGDTASRFACAIGFLFLATGIIFFYMGYETAAWSLVLIVGTLSVLAGTTGFCLGTAIYALLFRQKEKR